MYDTVSVYGTAALVAPAAAAVEASGSVMETVVRAKLSGAYAWQPGLLAVVVDGKTTDALGLGDAVFPAILSGWAMRKDFQQGGGGYLGASLAGYCLGCFLCEVTNSEGGQPALLLLVPAMFVAVLTHAARRGELSAIWK